MKLDMSAKTTKIATIVMIFLLLYAVAINYENNVGSQRYVVVAELIDGAENRYECLTMLEGITKEMEFEQSGRMKHISRDQMSIFVKWFSCGVL